jgi:diaminopimelate decarboxylase
MEAMHKSFHYIDNSLCVEDVPAEKLAQRFGTPLYVYSQDALLSNLRSFQEAFRGTNCLICYAMKANSNGSIVRLIAEKGSGMDVVSGGELITALRAGVPPERIVYSGVGKTAEEMELGIRRKILLFNAESGHELVCLNRIAERLKMMVAVSLRVNPDIDPETHPYISTGREEHKFGIPIAQVLNHFLMSQTLRNLVFVGLHVHLGSQITSFSPYRRMLNKLLKLVDDLDQAGYSIHYLDAGGGFGIPYQKGQKVVEVKKIAGLLRPAVQKRGLKLLLEPGRSIVGDAAILLTQVLYVKTGASRTFIVVDAAMNDLIRPALYNAYHEVIPLERRRTRTVLADVVGPVCETADFLARNRRIQTCSPGDYLAVIDVGAYGFSMASNYNGRMRPAEVLVQHKTARLIRKREQYSDLFRNEI